MRESYTLEVSSPGIDRPLKTDSDFLRCRNRRVKVFLREAVEGRIEFEGIVQGVEGDVLAIDAAGRVVGLSLSNITKAKQVL